MFFDSVYGGGDVDLLRNAASERGYVQTLV